MIDEATTPPDAPEDRDDRLNSVIAAYLQARDEGRPLDRAAILAREPDLADDLNRFFESDDHVEWLVTSVVPAVAAEGAWFGPYRVVRRLSRGGMGVVYEAEEPSSGRRVALKVLPTLGLPDPREQERFRREIELAARLDHPRIVPILDHGAAGGIPYCTMELIDGYDLRRVIRALKREDGSEPSGGPDGSGLQQVREMVSRAIGLPEGRPFTESLQGYWRFAASIGAQAARALAYSHGQRILHRDIKPANLLLDVDGNVHVTDYGLAKAGDDLDLTATGDLAGTLRFLAPERLNGWCDLRSDIYSLGLTLYELVLLRPAFESIDRSRLVHAIARTLPRRPRAINRAVPHDLEQIIQRAIEKDPAHRYATASALADDLERFLIGRPVLRQSIPLWRRAWAWSRRNPGTAGILAVIISVLMLAVGGVLFGLLMSRAAADARAREAQAQRAVAETARRESEYQSLVLRLQQIRFQAHSEGWSDQAWGLVRQASATRADAGLRDQAAATLAGVDDRVVRQLAGLGTSSVAFDREGKRLLLGGIEPDSKQDGRAMIVDLRKDQPPISCGLVGPGPVTFRDDGTPLQFVLQTERGLVLWDLDKRVEVARFELPEGATPTYVALRPDGSSVAASVASAEGQGQVLVWDVATRQVRQRFAGAATALAVSEDGEHLACGDSEGRIKVWGLPAGQRVAEFAQGRNTIESFGLARNPHRGAAGERGWLLAAGDSGGSIVVWDLTSGQPVSRCNSSDGNVTALAFSPDGATLASMGRTGTTILWDWSTGRNLLSMPAGCIKAAVAFSRDGRQLATGQYFPHDLRYSQICIRDLQPGRGIVTLRGLTGSVAAIVFTSDGQKLAALSQDWSLAIWDLSRNRLDAILDAPKGYSSDNIGLAFRGDGRQIAACAGREAKLWDVASGAVLQSWTLPPGLGDRVCFPSPGQLFIFRYETHSGAHVPFGEDLRHDPIVSRIRNPLAAEPLKPLVEFQGFAHPLHGAAVAGVPRFLIEEWYDGPGGRYQELRALNAANGDVLWSRRWPHEEAGSLWVGPGGQFVALGPRDGGRERPTLRSVLAGETVRDLAADFPGCPAPDGTSFFGALPGHPGVSLHRGDDRVLLGLGIDQRISSNALFSPDGKHVAWGNIDGSVMVADVEEIRSRLARIGLGW